MNTKGINMIVEAIIRIPKTILNKDSINLSNLFIMLALMRTIPYKDEIYT